MLFQEIQRGKFPMRKKKFFPEVGATAACTLRLIEGAEYCGQRQKERQLAKKKSRRQLVKGDSWFGSVKLAENLKCIYRKPIGTDEDEANYKYVICKEKGCNKDAHEFIGAVKTSSGGFPKKDIERIMKKWPSGSHLVLECTTPETGVSLVALGYKYNSRKVLCFVMTKDAGSTAPGLEPYYAKFPDIFGNVKQRKVQRPAVLGRYFGDSDKIDSHNHCRQFRLGLEKHWLTRDCWFRLDTTFIGQTVIDAYRSVNNQSELKNMTVMNFADRLSWDCVHNHFSKGISSKPQSFIPPSAEPVSAALIRNELFHDRMQEAASRITFDYLEEQHENADLVPRTVGVGRPPRYSNDSSTLTSEAESTIATNESLYSYPSIDIGDHDVTDGETKSKGAESNRSTKRACIICKMKTTKVCCNAGCKRNTLSFNQKVYFGTPLCNSSIIRKHLNEYGGAENKLSCLAIHREELRKIKYEDMKERSERRRNFGSGYS